MRLLSRTTPIDWPQGRALWDDCHSYDQIAKELGATREQVRKYAQRHWPQRDRSTLFCRSKQVQEPQSVYHRCDRCRGIYEGPVEAREHLDCPRARRAAA